MNAALLFLFFFESVDEVLADCVQDSAGVLEHPQCFALVLSSFGRLSFEVLGLAPRIDRSEQL